MSENVRARVRYQRRGPQSLRQAEEVGLIGSRIWTQPEIAVLLSEYRKHECLYDTKNVNYRNKLARQRDLDDIAEILCKIRPNTTAMDVKLKFNILRTQYHAELSKEKKSAGGGKPRVTTLWFMDHIKFVGGNNRREVYSHPEIKDSAIENTESLTEERYEDEASLSGDYIIEREDKYYGYEVAESENNEDPLSTTKKGVISSMIKTEKLMDDTESEMTSDYPEEKDDEAGGSDSPIISPATSTLFNKNKRENKVQGDENPPGKTEELYNLAEKTSARNSEEDLFGQIVAKKLKKITNPRKRADTEYKIFSILHSALVEELQDF